MGNGGTGRGTSRIYTHNLTGGRGYSQAIKTRKDQIEKLGFYDCAS